MTEGQGKSDSTRDWRMDCVQARLGLVYDRLLNEGEMMSDFFLLMKLYL